MIRIFSVLATAVSTGLLAAFAIGWLSFANGSRHDPDDITFLIHFLCGLFAAVGTLLIHCLIFTYFLGTGRWVKEVTLAYDLPDEPLHKTTRELKRKAFPAALSAMLVTIATSAAGGGVQLQDWNWLIHATGAIATLLVNAWAFGVEWHCLKRNDEVLAGVYREVDRVRLERGLPTNEEAWKQEAS